MGYPARERGQKQRGGEQKGQEMERIGEQSGKEDMKLHSEKQAYPRRGNPTDVKTY
jgi:hypothetical protein